LQSLNFIKMHGLGNDFVIVDGRANGFDLKSEQIQRLAHRQTGIGFDQLIWLIPSDQADFSCLIYNADGSEAKQCGNGMRCLAQFIFTNHLSSGKNIFTIYTAGGIVTATVLDDSHVQINMGVPQFNGVVSAKAILSFCNPDESLFLVSMGNPHAILLVESLKNYPVGQYGKAISEHSTFADGVNVGFMEIVARNEIRLRTFERGAGLTLACGSNACAAVAVGIANNLLAPVVRVFVELGEMVIEWGDNSSAILLTGPTQIVYRGVINF
jgi:diaminopimelate epimerase